MVNMLKLEHSFILSNFLKLIKTFFLTKNMHIMDVGDFGLLTFPAPGWLAYSQSNSDSGRKEVKLSIVFRLFPFSVSPPAFSGK